MRSNRTSKLFKSLGFLGLVMILTLALSVMASAASSKTLKKKTYKGKKGYYYCVNGKVKTSFTGIFKYKGKKWLIKKGKAATNFSGIYKDKKTKTQYVIKKGKVNTKFTGIYKYKGKSYKVKKGKVDKKYTGVYKYKGKSYKIKKGKVVATLSSSSSASTPSASATTKTTAAQMSSSVYTPTKTGFYYSQLNSTLQGIYSEFYNELMNDQSLSTSAAGVSQDDVNKAYTCLFYDHPEIFWINSSMSSSERSSMQSKIESAANSVLSGISSGASDYEKIKYVYDYIINSTTYSTSASDNQNIQSVLLNHSSVCAGYARTFQYLLNRMGMYCITVYGNVNGESHAWNIVRLGGDYYYVDATFGDRYAKNGKVDYSYLCYNDTDLKNIKGAVIMNVSSPACSGTKCDYYRLNGTYFETYNKNAAVSALTKAAKAGKKVCEMKFGSSSAYKSALSGLLSSGALQKNGYTSYNYDPDMHTISFVR